MLIHVQGHVYDMEGTKNEIRIESSNHKFKINMRSTNTIEERGIPQAEINPLRRETSVIYCLQIVRIVFITACRYFIWSALVSIEENEYHITGSIFRSRFLSDLPRRGIRSLDDLITACHATLHTHDITHKMIFLSSVMAFTIEITLEIACYDMRQKICSTLSWRDCSCMRTHELLYTQIYVPSSTIVSTHNDSRRLIW